MDKETASHLMRIIITQKSLARLVMDGTIENEADYYKTLVQFINEQELQLHDIIDKKGGLRV